jgi:N-acetylneuraminic acid mutarotase
MRRLAIGTLLAFALGLAVAEAQAPGKWVKLAGFPEPAEELYGAAAGGKVYVFGGLAPGWKPRALVFEYDPAADKWTKKKPMALPSHHVAFTELNGKLYAFGGFVPPPSDPPSWIPIDNAWEYDPAGDTWKALAPMPTARNHAAVGVVNGKIYVIGGRLGAAFVSVSSPTDVVEEYDPATDQWGAVKARMPTPRSAVAWGVHGGRIYVAGGEYQDDKLMAAFRALEAYDPGANRWIVLPRMPVPRHGLAGAVVGNRLHLVSGDVQSAGIAGMHLHSDSHDAFEIADR